MRHDLPLAAPLAVATFEAPQTAPPEAIYLGFGIATRSALSTGTLPFDALGMIMLAEQERRARGADRVVHLIADAHAGLNAFATPADVERLGKAVEATVRHVVDAFGYRHYETVRASTIDDALHADLRAQAAAADGVEPYAARQAADVEWARRVHRATVKVGWTTEPDLNRPTRGHDERYFDAMHAAVFGSGVTCVYGAAGRTLDPDRPRTTPYTSTAGEARLTLTTEADDVAALCGTSRRMRRHLLTLCAAAEAELGLPSGGDLPERIAAVLARIGLAA